MDKIQIYSLILFPLITMWFFIEAGIQLERDKDRIALLGPIVFLIIFCPIIGRIFNIW